MSKTPDLLSFCQRIGIFNVCAKTNRITYGPYGQLLLRQIKNQWLRANYNKFEHNFLIDSQYNLMQKGHNFDSNSFVKGVSNVFKIQELPVGLLNVHKLKFPASETLTNNFLTKNIINNESNDLTHLNAFHFYNDDHFSGISTSDYNIMKNDPVAFWQRERKNWWVKILNCPENVERDDLSTKQDNTDEMNILYKAFDDNNNVTSISYLENIQHITGLEKNNERLRSFLNSDDPESNFLLKDTTKLIITSTTCQHVLENVLIDSVQYRRNKAEVLLIENFYEKPKIVFRLDYKLAPFKACILYSTKENDDPNNSFYRQASDMKKILCYNQIDTLLMPVDGEEKIKETYDYLDEMGIPYTIYMPLTLTTDGICHIRNRETTLEEHLHISLIVDQFRAICNALCF